MKKFSDVKFNPANPHIRTFTDKNFYFWNIRPEDICIEDIAHSLANVCRYGGHCNQFYSVAEHSIVCSSRLNDGVPSVALWGLLHDAAEAYIGDICKPLKILLSTKVWDGSQKEIEDYEQDILKVIAEKFNLPWPMPQEVIEMDQKLFSEEMEFLWGNTSEIALNHQESEQLFLGLFYQLI